MRRSFVFAALISTAACSPPAEPPVVARVNALPARPASPKAPPAPAPEKPILSPLAAPSKELCAFSETPVELDLRLRPDGPPVVVVQTTPMRFVLPDAPGTSAWVEIRRPEVDMAAWASADDLPAYASRPTVFAGWFSPNPKHTLAWRTEGNGLVRLTAKAPTNVKPLAPLEVTADCSGVSLRAAAFDPAAPFGLGARPSKAALRKSEAIRLYARSDGDPVAELSVSYGQPVEVYGAENGRRRVAFSRYEGLTVAWVDAADVVAPLRIGGSHRTRPPIVRWPREEAVGELWTCHADVPLGLISGGDRALVGAVPAGATIQVVERDRGVARVILPETTGWMRVVGDASFVVLDASLSEPGCRVRHVRPE